MSAQGSVPRVPLSFKPNVGVWPFDGILVYRDLVGGWVNFIRALESEPGTALTLHCWRVKRKFCE